MILTKVSYFYFVCLVFYYCPDSFLIRMPLFQVDACRGIDADLHGLRFSLHRNIPSEQPFSDRFCIQLAVCSKQLPGILYLGNAADRQLQHVAFPVTAGKQVPVAFDIGDMQRVETIDLDPVRAETPIPRFDGVPLQKTPA